MGRARSLKLVRLLGMVTTAARDAGRVKTAAFKDALGVFLGVLAVFFCWHWIAKTGESVLSLFGQAAGIAAFVYVFKRTDWFD